MTSQLAPPAPQAGAAPAAGTELVHLNTGVGHYTQADNGNVRLRLYNSPVGSPTGTGWQFRDTHLSTPAAGKVAPALLPFGLQLAPTLTGSALASFTSEDKIKFGIGLAAANNAAPAAVAGQVGDEAITYTAPVASSSADLALRPTASGLDARLVLHKPGDGAAFTFALTLDPATHLDQLTDGTIRVVRPVTVTDDNGNQDVISQAEYFLERPIARDSRVDPAAPVLTGPATATLTADASGQQDVSVSIDPAWLQDPRRVYPVHLDLPILTATARAYSGRFGTVTSCAPDAPSPLTAIVVGTEGGCTYNGQAYFNTSSILHDTPIVSAKLMLYAPEATGPTGVQIQPNVPMTASDPLTTTIMTPPHQVNWNSAPSVVAGFAGLAESGSQGRWHSWDVTNLVQGWVNDAKVNNGVTLSSVGSPVLFASPLGLGANKPGEAPYLDIIYGPRPTIVPEYVDRRPISPTITSGITAHVLRPHIAPQLSDPNTTSIYGVSGSFAASSACSTNACTGKVNMSTVAGASGAPGRLGGSYIRLGVQLPCSTSPPASYWSTGGKTGANPDGNIPDVPTILQEAAYYGLVPIIDLQPPPGSCVARYNFSYWGQVAAHFVNDELLHDYPASTGGSVYFEFGNEVNTQNFAGYYPPAAIGYAGAFANAAAGLYQALSQNHYANFHIITAGMAAPTASTDPSQCNISGGNTANQNYNNINIASEALADAANKGVPLSALAAGVHPYHYNTADSNYWRNYYSEYGYYIGDGANLYNQYAGPCGDLGLMLNTWLNSLSGEPVIFTEENWTSNGATTPDCSQPDGCTGTYLVDLFTWLKDHGYTDPGSSPIRVMWYRGADDGSGGHPLGIYTPNGVGKQIYLNVCNNGAINNGQSSIDNDYYYLRNGACY